MDQKRMRLMMDSPWDFVEGDNERWHEMRCYEWEVRLACVAVPADVSFDRVSCVAVCEARQVVFAELDLGDEICVQQRFEAKG